MGVQQIDQPAGEGAEVHAALGSTGEELRGARGGVVQAVHGAVAAPGALVIEQRLEVCRILDLGGAIEAAPVDGEHGSAVEDPHALERGHDLEVRRTWVWGIE
ncbi:MAG: hypothetical protein IPF50_04420 [Proteobacteria bacterium]|nr:hypothetical protein [Pseudomonadota bacterium]